MLQYAVWTNVPIIRRLQFIYAFGKRALSYFITDGKNFEHKK